MSEAEESEPLKKEAAKAALDVDLSKDEARSMKRNIEDDEKETSLKKKIKTDCEIPKTSSQTEVNVKGEKEKEVVKLQKSVPIEVEAIAGPSFKDEQSVKSCSTNVTVSETSKKLKIQPSEDTTRKLEGTPSKDQGSVEADAKDSGETSAEEEASKGETGETSGNPGGDASKEDFTKPGLVRRKPRRNTLRQNKVKNGRAKFLRKRPHGGLSTFKRRKKEIGVIVPPTIFLLGGNINDPLNLNSLQDEEVNRAMNAVTPKSSPLPTPKHRRGEVEVILPRNLKDPLHLTSGTDDVEYLKLLSKKKRKRKRKRGNSGSGSGKEESFEANVPAEEPSATIEGAFVPPDTLPVKRDALTLSIKEAPKRRKPEGLDKIVSPVVPQPGAWKRLQVRQGPGANRKKKPATTPKINPRNERYQYGNYDRYYGYRNTNRDVDLRLQYFMQHPDLFLDKDVLDIGCNVGHVTLSVARDLGARSIVGLDIDKRLIGIARKNIRHYVTVAETPAYSNSTRMPTPRTPHLQIQDSPANQYHIPNSPANQMSPYPQQYSPASRSPFPHHYVPNSPAYQQSPCPHQNSPASRSPFPNQNSPANPSPMLQSPANNSPTPMSPATDRPESLSSNNPHPAHPLFFPISMPIMYGPLDLPGFATPDGASLSSRTFPNNVSFVQGSYVLESDALLTTETAQFDVIMCLSVTKWLHLNWGDAGLKRAFRRMFAQLRPGGKLILEPQAWPSYHRKKALTEKIYRNYVSIELVPDKFIEYLLSPAVGFSSVEELGAPAHPNKGFRRPIHVLTKPGQTPSSCNTPVTYTPYSQRTCVRKPVYTSLGAEAFDNEEEKKGKDK